MMVVVVVVLRASDWMFFDLVAMVFFLGGYCDSSDSYGSDILEAIVEVRVVVVMVVMMMVTVEVVVGVE